MDPLKYIVPGRKRLPYGMMNFADIRQDNYYYVDKTRFIPMIEEADRFFFFIRPRRFGKSLTLNLLRQYYDVRTRACPFSKVTSSTVSSCPISAKWLRTVSAMRIS